MSRFRLPYGTDVVLDFPLYTAGTAAFKVGATSAAGDVKVYHDNLISTTVSGQTIAFTSGGTYVVRSGDTITGATSAKTAVVLGVRITSGTWAGGDAAGSLFVRSPSGAFQSENLNVGANSNVATIGADLDAAGLFKSVALGLHAVGVPGTMLQGRQGAVIFHDAAGAEWDDATILFETRGHEAAFDPEGCVWTATGDAAGQTTTSMVMDGLAAVPATAPLAGFYFEVVSGTGVGQAGYVKTVTPATDTTIVPYATLGTALDATSIVKFYRNAPLVPSHLVDAESGITLGGSGATRTQADAV